MRKFSHLEISPLSKLLVAVVKSAEEGLCTEMCLHVCLDVSALHKALVAHLAAVGSLSCVTTFVCLRFRQTMWAL